MQPQARAYKSNGALIWIGADEFQNILAKNPEPLVVYFKDEGLFKKTAHWYLTSYKGLVFYTGIYEPLQLAESVEIIHAEKFWFPE